MSCSHALFVDLYELTMAQAYFLEGINKDAVFSTFVRRLPENRNYLVACGLEEVLNFLENFGFTQKDIDYLSSQKIFKDEFLDYLKELRFTGDVYALKEGTIFFENEPLLEIKAPIIEAQLLETYVLNQIQLQTMMATKGARISCVSGNKVVVDFGSRRAHGLDAAIKAARAFYISGMKATSNVIAGKMYNIPITGTMAHSYVQVHRDEFSAFKAFSSIYSDTFLLIDTYSIDEGLFNVIKLFKELKNNFRISGVRIDSGDLFENSKKVRNILDKEGLNGLKIIVSGGIDEYIIEEILKYNLPIDGFGVGTKVIVSDDVPHLDIVYKLTQYNGEGKYKKSEGKATLPYQKQIYRREQEGIYKEDILALWDETLEGTPLLVQVMENGKIKQGAKEDIETMRARCMEEIKKLPSHLRSLHKAEKSYPVKFSPLLKEIVTKIRNL